MDVVRLGRRRVVAGLAALALVGTAGCTARNNSRSGDGEFSPPDRVTVLVHTGPGGGADLLARETISIMEKEQLVKPGQWTVENRDGGNGAVALNYLRGQADRDDLVLFSSNVHLVGKLVTDGVEVSTLDFTPIVSLYDDMMAVAVKADGPYADLKAFIDAAKAAPDTLVQAGGSTTATDALSGQTLQRDSGAKWKYLSFPGGGERKTALLRGDAQLYMTEPIDMLENVEAGEMRCVAIIGDKRSSVFPDTPTTVELGFKSMPPVQTRGVVGPEGMSPEAVAFYEDVFGKLVETPTWKDFIERSSASATFRTSDGYREHLEQQEVQHKELFRETGQLRDS
jgi:putative tricarboxylic transport membrane protein